MRPERTFTPIDFAAWPRRETFYYFSKMAPTGYSLTVDLDATALHQTLKAANCRLFPAYLWLVTRNLQRQEEFRLAEQDGVLGHYKLPDAPLRRLPRRRQDLLPPLDGL